MIFLRESHHEVQKAFPMLLPARAYPDIRPTFAVTLVAFEVTSEATEDGVEVEVGGRIVEIEVVILTGNTETEETRDHHHFAMTGAESGGVDGNHTEVVEHHLPRAEDAHQIMDHGIVEMRRQTSKLIALVEDRGMGHFLVAPLPQTQFLHSAVDMVERQEVGVDAEGGAITRTIITADHLAEVDHQSLPIVELNLQLHLHHKSRHLARQQQQHSLHCHQMYQIVLPHLLPTPVLGPYRA